MFERNRDRGLGWPSVLVGLLVVTAGCTTSLPEDVPSAPTSATPEPTPDDGTTTGLETTSPDDETTTAEPAPTHATDVPTKHPSLDSQLVGLLNAENRTAYATNRSLELRNESVLVVVELHPNRSLPTEFDLTVRAQHENLVQARVPLDHLLPLAEHANVSFVRPPREPSTDSLSTEDSPDDQSS